MQYICGGLPGLSILSKCKRVKNTTLYISSCPSLWLFKKSGGYFTLLEGFHSRTEWKITQKDANFNLKEWNTTRKGVVHMALKRVLFHPFKESSGHFHWNFLNTIILFNVLHVRVCEQKFDNYRTKKLLCPGIETMEGKVPDHNQ